MRFDISCSSFQNNFNPRSHEGNDHCEWFICWNRRISIHVPTKGTTRYRKSTGKNWKYFNPRSHEGNDLIRTVWVFSVIYFNPRSHEGNDFHRYFLSGVMVDFNPRSHEGNDYIPDYMYANHLISIHVPTKGTTSSGRMPS